jgi:acetyltransferase
MYGATGTRALDLVRSGGIPCVEWPDEVVHALNSRRLIGYRESRSRRSGRSSAAGLGAESTLLDLSEQIIAALEEAGIEHALGDLVYPGALTLRGEGPWVVRADGFPHKTAAGALRLGVSTVDLPAAVDDLARVSEAAGLIPKIRVAAFIQHDYELIVTFWRDHLEGDGWMIGQGGTDVERTGDVAIGRSPRTIADVRRVFSRTAIGQNLLNTSEVPAQKFMEVVLALGTLFRSRLRQLRELELNPIAIAKGETIVLDALPSLLPNSAIGVPAAYRTGEAP